MTLYSSVNNYFGYSDYNIVFKRNVKILCFVYVRYLKFLKIAVPELKQNNKVIKMKLIYDPLIKVFTP